ncbi:hypothetical protein [Burkholderia stagnalis]|uniref:hypothetical protein n=1 Tax=Burkholderia stagnalis TaxID=1503054 RepID=UPI0012D98E5F|nr:hypothetical protein [Burkholderia stagnalis]
MNLQHLAKAEEGLRAAIRLSDVPFLGLMRDALPPIVITSIDLLTLGNPGVDMYTDYLRRFPALFSVHLTACIMEGMGQDGHFELYSHIQRAIGAEWTLSQQQREVLWRAFRRAILELGFEPSPLVSGPHFMANEYLRQVGVPLAFADDLAERMLSFARRLGLPDVDDPDAIMSWQRALEERLNSPFSMTARKAVSLDAKGYYTQAFLRVSATVGTLAAVEPCNPLERAMARAFERQGHSNAFRRASLPYVTFNDGQVGIFVPGGEERDFEFQVDGNVQLHQSNIEDAFVSLSNPLTREVIIKESAGMQSSRCQLWEDSRPNRLLMFTDAGRFKCAAQLQADPAAPVIIAPGTYTCLSRFAPVGVEVEELLDEPALHTFGFSVHPGQSTTIKHGPASLTFQGESQPYWQWTGVSRTTKEGVDVYFGKLEFAVEFPAEWSHFAGVRYVINLSASGSATKLQLPFTVDASSRAVVAIADAMKAREWAPGFVKLLAEVSRAGENRVLIRSSVNYWLGLSHVTSSMHFVCDDPPRNLQHGLSENVRIQGNVVKPHDTISKTLRLVFRLDERRYQSLSWNVPGIFIEVESPLDSGGFSREKRAIGSVESISVMSSKQVLVSASEPGALSVGDWVLNVDFSKHPTKRIPASLLASRLTPQASTLLFTSGVTGLSHELLRLVRPHYAACMAAKVVDGQFMVQFSTPDDVQGVLVRVSDVISGKDAEIALEANTGVWAGHRLGRSRMTCLSARDGGYSVSLYFDLEGWPSGAWVFGFDACVGGIWGHLENQRQDALAAGFICDQEGRQVRSDALLGCLSALSDKDSLTVLSRVQAVMSTCYMQESWESIQWIAGMWRALLARWNGRIHEAVTTLVDLACARAPEDASSSWLLQVTAGAVMPEIYTLPAVVYGKVSRSTHPVSQVLRAIANLKGQYPRVFPDLIHVAAASGFSNFFEVAGGGEPRGFRLDSYIEGLRQTEDRVSDSFKLADENFQPSDGDWLGPVHHRFATRSLEMAYECSLAGNEIRRGQAMGLCRFLKQKFRSFPHDYHPRLAGHAPVVAPWVTGGDENLPEELAQRRQNLDQITHLISLLAFHCRLGARNEMALRRFMDVLRSSDIPVEPCLAYLLQVGGAAFAYYLLLWELVQKAESIR